MTEQNVPRPDDRLGTAGVVLLGLYNVILAIALFTVLVVLINCGTEPTPHEALPGAKLIRVTEVWYVRLQFEVWLLVLIMTGGALGSYVHSCTSFTDYAGNKTLARSWVWWYLLRTPIGISLAIVFYFVLRGGLLTTGASGANLNSYGLAAFTAMAGMFSKNATDKLREIFEATFRTAEHKGDETRKDKLAGS
jgi:TRAP-type uncharacterized transport system fused permease subunit